MKEHHDVSVSTEDNQLDNQSDASDLQERQLHFVDQQVRARQMARPLERNTYKVIIVDIKCHNMILYN